MQGRAEMRPEWCDPLAYERPAICFVRRDL